MVSKIEFANVMSDYEGLGLNVVGVDASDKFFAELAGVTEPERKRKIIGKGFIDVFDAEAHKIKDVKWLAQGTIYPDCIETQTITATPSQRHPRPLHSFFFLERPLAITHTRRSIACSREFLRQG